MRKAGKIEGKRKTFLTPCMKYSDSHPVISTTFTLLIWLPDPKSARPLLRVNIAGCKGFS
jgi:hypothetical protein